MIETVLKIFFAWVTLSFIVGTIYSIIAAISKRRARRG